MVVFDPSPSFRQRLLVGGLGALSFVWFGAGSALAGPGVGGAGERLTPAQQQKIFPEMKSLAIRHHRARIAILQKGERCLSATRDSDAMRTCMREERSAYQAERRRHHDEVRSVFQSNNIPFPEWGRRGGRRSERLLQPTVARLEPVSAPAPEASFVRLRRR